MAILLAFLCAGLASACGSSSPSASTFAAFPIPGSRVASPHAQLTFRGGTPSRLAHVVVTGSQTGRHKGRLEADSDDRGASFLPTTPFAAGEQVTVRTGVKVLGATKGTYHFTVAQPAGAIKAIAVVAAPRVAGDVWKFRSRPDLSPPAVEIVKSSTQADPGEVFVANQTGPVQDGAMILNAQGTLVWFHPVPHGDEVTDLRVQSYQSKPVLTWWQGFLGNGIGVGEGVIDDSSYRQIATVHAGNGLSADLHEFQLTSAGTALVTAYYPVLWNYGSGKSKTRTVVLDCVAQEIDVRTGLVLFQWDSLDHVPVSASEVPPPPTGQPYDYFHINSVKEDADGNLVLSARNTWAAYKVSRRSAHVMWTLGGKHSTFKLPRGGTFAFQHDVRVLDASDSRVTLFDDGAGPPTVHKQSRGLSLSLSTKSRTATVTGQYLHSPPLSADFEGNVQTLANGDAFLGWGQQPYFTELNPSGQIVFDGRFLDANTSYRAYRFEWAGTPVTSPKIAVTHSGSTATVYASWNGATGVASWRVLEGTSASSLHQVSSANRAGFETQLSVAAAPFVAVQAVDSSGKVIGTSATTAGQ